MSVQEDLSGATDFDRAYLRWRWARLADTLVELEREINRRVAVYDYFSAGLLQCRIRNGVL